MPKRILSKKRGAPPFPRYSEETLAVTQLARKIGFHASEIAKAFPSFIHENTVRSKMQGKAGWSSRAEFETYRKIVKTQAERILSEIPA
jgi:hypothetical protein